jgi:curved DNA-binding protein CbpA
MTNQIQTHYDTLQVARTASEEVIRGAYRYLCQKWHPDKHTSNRAEAERITQLINEAYEVLSDPGKRRGHDIWIAQQEELLRNRTSDSRDENAEAGMAAKAEMLALKEKYARSIARTRLPWYVLSAIAGAVFFLTVIAQFVGPEKLGGYVHRHSGWFLIGFAWVVFGGVAEMMKEAAKKLEKRDIADLQKIYRRRFHVLAGTLIFLISAVFVWVLFNRLDDDRASTSRIETAADKTEKLNPLPAELPPRPLRIENHCRYDVDVTIAVPVKSGQFYGVPLEKLTAVALPTLPAQASKKISETADKKSTPYFIKKEILFIAHTTAQAEKQLIWEGKADESSTAVKINGEERQFIRYQPGPGEDAVLDINCPSEGERMTRPE